MKKERDLFTSLSVIKIYCSCDEWKEGKWKVKILYLILFLSK